MSPERPPRVFVYGTLRPGGRNAGLAARCGQPQTQAATLSAFRLLHLSPENYPAIVPGEPGERVQGEVLTYPPQVWAQVFPLLDALEGVDETPPLYHRQRVTVALASGEAEEVWVYVYARTERLTLPGAVPVPGGDWFQHP
ncbi:gamma-glutamylcyclotransferase [Deinococcus sp. SDU3-2]|uniref:Putative gamma-glutamylcyclotransferase n=1 Tax=Deinococcus terrestris TaxID=2651870 RepID=A0A7X1TS57_9DEIO|nr:gamma-glutamylcyclotransferase family protein [Deinococcus terrestris]MPY67480.1 gamma-glutamylcyclotransferase [Deinococcus terrestris]